MNDRRITNKDKNVMTFTLAVLVLAMIILGVSFSYQDRSPKIIHSMDVILTQKAHTEIPEEADYLAANNQLGGGNLEEKSRPTDIVSGPAVTPDGVSKQQTKKQQKSRQQQDTAVLTSVSSQQQQLSAKQQQTQQHTQQNNQRNSKQQKLAQMKEEIAKKIQRYAKKPRTKYISSSTKAYEYAPYINQWVKTIERTGDLNYPEKAKKKTFKGEVMLTVGINKDGSLHEIKIIKPSKYRFLDEAAKHIVEIAQPFEPLPETKEPVDILYITRTWQFLPGHLLRQK
ncbi:energy transducer TonB family protein [Marinicella gelatinilytica]|uniref:energy transducer TonB family protein n=1 Tax=Marinicella gelatinilytica TaxID=2996017 RepID=UPI002260D1C8|nr:energy transducer TonB [Marinicella gelatinilytica]MCX7544255.1 energy transducer TonB [Marinicella gelatinilytica]